MLMRVSVRKRTFVLLRALKHIRHHGIVTALQVFHRHFDKESERIYSKGALSIFAYPDSI